MKTSEKIICIVGCIIMLVFIIAYISSQSYEKKNSEYKEELDRANRLIAVMKDTQDLNFTDAKHLEKYKSIIYRYLEKEDMVIVCLDSDYTYYHDVHVLEYCEFITDFENDYFRVEPREKVKALGYTMCPDCQMELKSYLENHPK